MPAALDIAGFSVLLLLVLAVAAPLFRPVRTLQITLVFSLAAVASLAAVVAGVMTVADGSVASAAMTLGLPGLPFHLRLDPLAGFFLVVIGLMGFFVSIYSIGYVKGYGGQRSMTQMICFYTLFLAGMLLVVLADDAYFFLVAWELMAAASYFLVMYEDEKGENRRAAFLYLLIAHVGALAILLAFGVMAGQSGRPVFDGYTFDAMRTAQLTPGWAAAAF
ncbi:MAG: proton-conducting transporter membrane subunit, partial [Desulfuromonadaceae bacterium]|nr:proton-conducting transporter membrane subunit [Desulfuromonadaceae bacterium]